MASRLTDDTTETVLGIEDITLPPSQAAPRNRNRLSLIVIGIGTLLGIFAFALSVPLYFESRRVQAADLYPAELLELGFSPTAYAVFAVGINIFVLAVALGAAIFLLRRGTSERMVLVVAFFIALSGATFSPVLDWLLYTGTAWNGLLFVVWSLSYVSVLLMLYWFPDGEFSPPWMRWIFVAGALLMIARTGYRVLTQAQLSSPIFVATLVLSLGLGIAAQIYRYRNVASPEQQQQSKWILYGGVIAVSFTIGWYLLEFVLPRAVSGFPGIFVALGSEIFLSGVPRLVIIITLVLASLRFHLWHIDVTIRRSVVYGALTVFLASVFFIGVFLLQALFQQFTGMRNSNFPPIIATVTVMLLYNPTRLRLQRLVDRYLFNVRLDTLEHPALAQSQLNNPEPMFPSRQNIGGYVVNRLLGRGGMGEVYLGYHPGLAREVAIKVLLLPQPDQQDLHRRFEREARMVAQLRHPNIVQVYDFGEQGELHYMVMEYIAGQTLGAYLNNHPPLALDQIKLILTELAMALDYAHELGIIHRDVKPANILLQPITTTNSNRLFPYRVVLTDFGVARQGVSSITQTGVMVGTLNYMAPEQITGQKDLDRRVDIYALGVVLYQLLTGTLPYADESVGSLLLSHLYQPIPDPRLLRAELPAATTQVMKRALAKNPQERYASAAALVHDLATIEDLPTHS